jgi:hypothetical protein
MSNSIINEVIQLHQFFEAWLAGSLTKSRETYQRFESVMAEDFGMIPPDSELLPREVITDIIWQEHGAKAPSFKIEIRNPSVRKLTEALYLASYEEWQFDSEPTARIATALMKEEPSGIRWLHVHESWLPQAPAN